LADASAITTPELTVQAVVEQVCPECPSVIVPLEVSGEPAAVKSGGTVMPTLVIGAEAAALGSKTMMTISNFPKLHGLCEHRLLYEAAS
jgi:hypothetical protein